MTEAEAAAEGPKKRPRSPDLRCYEDLDRVSPELWPPKVPGPYDLAEDFIQSADQKVVENVRLGPEDVSFMNELGKLTPDHLMEYIKKMQYTAYYLGLLEDMELRRGDLLRVLNAQPGEEEEKNRKLLSEPKVYYSDRLPRFRKYRLLKMHGRIDEDVLRKDAELQRSPVKICNVKEESEKEVTEERRNGEETGAGEEEQQPADQ